MAVIRGVIQYEHISGLARDRSVNTFHFNGPTDETTLTALQNALVTFLGGGAGVGGQVAAVGAYLGSVISSYRVKLYDVTNEPSGPPMLDVLGDVLPSRISAGTMPTEVAVCGSFEGTPTTGLVQRRRRGRIYLGPLNPSAQETGTDGVPRPSAAIRRDLRLGLVKLAAQVDTVAEWVVYSRPFPGRPETPRPGRAPLPAIAPRAGSTIDISRVWVDDAFDTQRRRGERPIGRGTVSSTQ